MREVLRALKAGDTVQVGYERDGKRATVTVTTQAPEREMTLAPLPFEDWIEHGDADPFMPFMFKLQGRGVRGLELAKLDEDLGAYFKTKEGVLVVKAPASGALRLKSGDVIQKIDGDAVSEPVTVLDKLRARGEARTVRMEIVRQGRKLEIEGTIEVAARGPRDKIRRVEIVTDEDDEDAHGR
jgi:S1-C subfamily serine protease